MAAADEVIKAYDAVFGRAPDAGGLEYYTNLINSGATAEDVRQSLAGSPEAVVREAYSTSLNRRPEAGGANDDGLQYWTGLLSTGQATPEQVRAGIAASPEAQGLLGTAKPPVVQPPIVKPPVVPPVVKPPTITDFTPYTPQLNAIYQRVFGRDVDPTGLSYYGNLLAQGTSPADIEASLRGSSEFQTPTVQNFQRGTRTVPFGSQLIGQNVQQVAQYTQPAAQAGPAMGPPSLQSFLAGTPGAANLSPFQQSLQYQAALPGMIQPFNPANIPATYQQTLSPRPRLDISQTTIPSWLQASIDAQNKKDGIEVSDLQKFNTANQVSTNSGLGTTTAGVTTGGTGNLAAGGIDPRIIQGYTQIGRAGGDIDMPGAQYWGGLLASGTPIADIYAGMAATPEGLKYAQNQAAKAAAAVTNYNE